MRLPPFFSRLLGGLGIVNPTTNSIISHENSTLISAPLVDLIACQATDFDPADLYDDIKQLRLEVDLDNDQRHENKKRDVILKAPKSLQFAVQLLQKRDLRAGSRLFRPTTITPFSIKGILWVRSTCAMDGN